MGYNMLRTICIDKKCNRPLDLLREIDRSCLVRIKVKFKWKNEEKVDFFDI